MSLNCDTLVLKNDYNCVSKSASHERGMRQVSKKYWIVTVKLHSTTNFKRTRHHHSVHLGKIQTYFSYINSMKTVVVKIIFIWLHCMRSFLVEIGIFTKDINNTLKKFSIVANCKIVCLRKGVGLTRQFFFQLNAWLSI